MSNLCRERKKISKLGIYYHFLVQIWRLELSTRIQQYVLDIETVQLVTTKLEIPDTKITQTNTMELLQLDLDT